MAASSRGSRAFRDALRAPSVCSRCATGLPRTPIRFYSASVVTETAPSNTTTPPLSTQPTQPPKTYEIRSGMIVTRPPLLTRNLHPFEEAFFFYQKRLEERLNTPFIKSLYFKPDTPRQLDWDIKIKERQGSVAKELGLYQGKGSKAWDDELKVGDKLSSQESMIQSLLKDAEARVSDDAEIIPESEIVRVPAPNSRVTEADKKGDAKRLDRQLDRTLYLVVKGKEGWCFPADTLKDENLHEAAKRVMDQAAGVNMNTWVVGRVPVAHLVTRPELAADGKNAKAGRKTFFLRARIMAGQADLANNPFGYTDFKWLTREELEKVLDPDYYQGVRYMMADR